MPVSVGIALLVLWAVTAWLWKYETRWRRSLQEENDSLHATIDEGVKALKGEK